MTPGYVLIVDDDEPFRKLIAEVLTDAGYAVHDVASAAAAYALADTIPPIGALVDVNLPTINGYEVCRRLKEQYRIPVVLVSGYRTEPLDEAAGLLLGADEYLVKPIDPHELLGRLRRLVPQASGRHEPEALARLTPREREVLQLLVDGLRPCEVAQSLVIAPRTVEAHVQRILGKLDVHSRGEAIAAAVRHGLRPSANGGYARRAGPEVRRARGSRS